MKQGNNNKSCSTCNCEYLQLHLLSSPKSLFSEKFNVRVISIILFIPLVALLFLKYLSISEIKLVPLLISIGFLNLVICFVVITNVTRFCHMGKTLYHFGLGGYFIFVSLRKLNNKLSTTLFSTYSLSFPPES